MIRLAVIGEEDLWQSVGARVRGAIVRYYSNTTISRLPPDDYDALLVVTPNQSAMAMVEQALADGKFVLNAVPTGISVAFLAELEANSKRSTGQLLLVNPEHFVPSRQLLRQQLETEKLGLPGLIRIHRWEPVPATTAETPPAIPASLILDLELCLSLMRLAPNVVYATEARRPAVVQESGRTIQVHLGFEGGPMALIGYSSALPLGDGYRSLSVMGSAGAAYVDDHQNMQLLYQGEQPRAIFAAEGCRSLVHLVQDFVDGIQAKRDFSSSLSAWRRVWRVAQAVEHSLRSQQAISLEVC